MTAYTPVISAWKKAADPDVFAACIDQDRVLVTADNKLTKLLATSNATAPSVVIVRGFGGPVSEVADALESAFEFVTETIESRGHAVLSVGPSRPDPCPAPSAGRPWDRRLIAATQGDAAR